jgi:hypothetical protein
VLWRFFGHQPSHKIAGSARPVNRNRHQEGDSYPASISNPGSCHCHDVGFKSCIRNPCLSSSSSSVCGTEQHLLYFSGLVHGLSLTSSLFDDSSSVITSHARNFLNPSGIAIASSSDPRSCVILRFSLPFDFPGLTFVTEHSHSLAPLDYARGPLNSVCSEVRPQILPTLWTLQYRCPRASLEAHSE